jgi:hypothetical protein
VDVSLASWLVIAVALAFANLPFVNESVFAFLPYRGGRRKPFPVRLVELIVLYFIVGAIGYLLEARIGNVFLQTWEFYAISGCLFVVLAFPGFVLRYLRKQRH